MKKLLTLLAFVLLANGLSAQAADKRAQFDIRTNTVCDMCEKTIETELLYEKGVKAVDVDLATNVIHVTVDSRKTDLDKVRTAITKLGYSADDVPPDMAAREKLPDCCKKEGCGMPHASPEQPK